jgi:hypothetical protein
VLPEFTELERQVARHPALRELLAGAVLSANQFRHSALSDWHCFHALIRTLDADIRNQTVRPLSDATVAESILSLVSRDESEPSVTMIHPNVPRMLAAVIADVFIVSGGPVKPVHVLGYFLSRPNTVAQHVMKDLNVNVGEAMIQLAALLDSKEQARIASYYVGIYTLLSIVERRPLR